MISLTKQNLIKRRGLGLAVIAATAALLALFTASPASATNLTIVQNYSVQQTMNDPCVIGNGSCSGSVIPYFSPTGKQLTSPYYFYSPTYTAGSNYWGSGDTIPLNFSLGIDENTTGSNTEQLLYWDTFVCSSNCTTSLNGGVGTSTPTLLGSNWMLDNANSYTGPKGIHDFHNGNGYSDALLEGFHLNANDMYYFQVGWGNDTDGMEQFFIVPGAQPPPNVPEPGSLGIFGAGLVGLGLLGFFANRRRRV